MSSNTTEGPTRRERMRAETIAEIKASAQRQLLEHGPSGISLRAIAREVGVSPAALYRYFDSLDSLLTELCCDYYDELIDVTLHDMGQWEPECHLERIKAWIWAFRVWAVAHKREFELMLNTPEGQSSMSLPADLSIDQYEGLHPVMKKSIDHARLCGGEFAAFYRETGGEGLDFSQVELPELSEGLQYELQDKCADLIIGERLPLNWVFAFTSGWVRVFGLVVMEAFGSLPVQQNVDEFYKTQIVSMMKDFGIES